MGTETEHPGVARVRDYLEKFAQGRTDELRDFFADDIVWHVATTASRPLRRAISTGLADFFIRLGELTEGSFRVEADEVLADDDHAALFWRAWASRGDRSLEAVGAMGFKFDSDGKFSESWFLYNDQAAYNAFHS